MVGLVGYFRCSIPNFSQNAYPLYQLLKRNHSTHKQGKEQIEEQEIHQEALDQFLQHLVTPPILTNPDMETFHITHRCIRAKIRLCCALFQIHDEKLRLISFGGHTRVGAELKYHTLSWSSSH